MIYLPLVTDFEHEFAQIQIRYRSDREEAERLYIRDARSKKIAENPMSDEVKIFNATVEYGLQKQLCDRLFDAELSRARDLEDLFKSEERKSQERSRINSC